MVGKLVQISDVVLSASLGIPPKAIGLVLCEIPARLETTPQIYKVLMSGQRFRCLGKNLEVISGNL